MPIVTSNAAVQKDFTAEAPRALRRTQETLCLCGENEKKKGRTAVAKAAGKPGL
jgi:hypothetical protein